ncbi:hypothetical protein Hdeb2414_s0002g00077751 [Helianthus debilis subsp. tardiflorus]
MEESSGKTTKKHPWFWSSAVASIVLRLVLIVYFPNTLLNFSSRPEVSTPITSLRRHNLTNFNCFCLLNY